MPALQGVAVLVTRPAPQAAPLCRLLEVARATVVRLPTLDIKPVVDPTLTARMNPLERWDLVIFTSTNAVKFGAALFETVQDLTAAAIGPATARALGREGVKVTLSPEALDSETLLLHPLLAEPAGRRILIVKGLHGRDMLRQELVNRGAHVVVADVYERQVAIPGATALAAVEADFAAAPLRVITVTSIDIAAGLLLLATPALRQQLDRTPWVVPSSRVAAAVRERGLTAPILQAQSATDHDLVAAIIRWRSSVSGA